MYKHLSWHPWVVHARRRETRPIPAGRQEDSLKTMNDGVFGIRDTERSTTRDRKRCVETQMPLGMALYVLSAQEKKWAREN